MVLTLKPLEKQPDYLLHYREALMTNQGSWGFLTKLICSLSIAMLLMPAAAFSAPQSAMAPGNASASSPADPQPANGTQTPRYPPANGCPAYLSKCESAFIYCIAGTDDFTQLPDNEALILERIERLKKEQEDFFWKARNEKDPKDPKAMQYFMKQATEKGVLIAQLLANLLSWKKDQAKIQKCSQEFEECCRNAADEDSSITWPKG